jgi:hypothetical protein
MVCEEADLSAIYAEPPSDAYDEMREIAIAAGRTRGVDYTGGRRAPAWAKAAGFEIVHVDAYHPHFIDGRHVAVVRMGLLAEELGAEPHAHVGDEELDAHRLRELAHAPDGLQGVTGPLPLREGLRLERAEFMSALATPEV